MDKFDTTLEDVGTVEEFFARRGMGMYLRPLIIKFLSKMIRLLQPPVRNHWEQNQDYLDKVAKTQALVDGDETLGLWSKWHQVMGYTWEQKNPGYAVQIGWLDIRPVVVCLFWNLVGGKLICFYYVSSEVSDHEMLGQFLDKTFPGVPRTDIMNFHNVMGDVVPPPRKQERSKKYRDFLRGLNEQQD